MGDTGISFASRVLPAAPGPATLAANKVPALSLAPAASSLIIPPCVINDAGSSNALPLPVAASAEAVGGKDSLRQSSAAPSDSHSREYSDFTDSGGPSNALPLPVAASAEAVGGKESLRQSSAAPSDSHSWEYSDFTDSAAELYTEPDASSHANLIAKLQALTNSQRCNIELGGKKRTLMKCHFAAQNNIVHNTHNIFIDERHRPTWIEFYGYNVVNGYIMNGAMKSDPQQLWIAPCSMRLEAITGESNYDYFLICILVRTDVYRQPSFVIGNQKTGRLIAAHKHSLLLFMVLIAAIVCTNETQGQ